jgi:predicted sulfurtransferase
MALTFSFDMQTVLHPESYLSIILQGFKKVYNVSGGIHAYAVKADSSVPTY